MKNKRKHTEQADKAEELAKRKLAKLSKVTTLFIITCTLAFVPQSFDKTHDKTQVSKPDSPEVVDIKNKAQEVLESRKNINNLVDIIARLDTGEKTDVLMAAVQGLKRVLVAALEKGEVGKEAEMEEGADGKLKTWMAERLQEGSKKLASLLHHPKTSVSSLVLAAITSLLKAAWHSSGETNKWGQVHCSATFMFLHTHFSQPG